MEGAELLQLPATQAGKVSCRSEGKSGITVGGVWGRRRGGGGAAGLGIAEQGEATGQLPAGVRRVSLMPVIAPSGT